MDEYADGYGDILGAEATSGGGGGWADWGGMVRDTVGFAARSYIDAELNAPTRLEERRIAMRADDGELYSAGDVVDGANRKSWLPWLLIGSAVLAVVLIVKD